MFMPVTQGKVITAELIARPLTVTLPPKELQRKPETFSRNKVMKRINIKREHYFY